MEALCEFLHAHSKQCFRDLPKFASRPPPRGRHDAKLNKPCQRYGLQMWIKIPLLWYGHDPWLLCEMALSKCKPTQCERLFQLMRPTIAGGAWACNWHGQYSSKFVHLRKLLVYGLCFLASRQTVFPVSWFLKVPMERGPEYLWLW